MKILITGAAGLYGVHLTDLLCRQRWVRQVIGVDDFSRKFFTKDPFIKSPSFDRKFKLLKMKYQGLTKWLFWEVCGYRGFNCVKCNSSPLKGKDKGRGRKDKEKA